MQALLERMDALTRSGAEALQDQERGEEIAFRPQFDKHGPSARRLSRPRIVVAPSAPQSPDPVRRRRCWIAACLRRAYDLEWVPEHMAAHIVAIAWQMALVLTLRGGTQLLDRFDEIELVGPVDYIAIAELVACVQRRGWQAVKISGTAVFRTAAARALIAAGIEVVNPLLTVPGIEALTAPNGSGHPRDATPFTAVR